MTEGKFPALATLSIVQYFTIMQELEPHMRNVEVRKEGEVQHRRQEKKIKSDVLFHFFIKQPSSHFFLFCFVYVCKLMHIIESQNTRWDMCVFKKETVSRLKHDLSQYFCHFWEQQGIYNISVEDSENIQGRVS